MLQKEREGPFVALTTTNNVILIVYIYSIGTYPLGTSNIHIMHIGYDAYLPIYCSNLKII